MSGGVISIKVKEVRGATPWNALWDNISKQLGFYSAWKRETRERF